MRRFLLIALLGIAITLLACGKLRKDTHPPGEAGAQANAIGEADGESDPTEGSTLPADTLDVCSQLTREEVEAALGRPVKEPTRGSDLTSRRSGTLTSSCMFGGDEGFVSLDVKRQAPTSTTTWNAAKSYEELKDRIVKARSGESFTRLAEVSGIGVNAFAETRDEMANFQTTELRVLTKQSILTVRVVGLSAVTSTLEAAKILAGKVVLRLEKYERAGITPAQDVSDNLNAITSRPVISGVRPAVLISREANPDVILLRAPRIVRLIGRDKHNVSVADISRLYARDKNDFEAMRLAVAVEALPESWREHFWQQLARSGI